MISGAIGLLSARGRRIDSIVVDAYLEEVHKNSAQITRYPIEFGASVSDHMIQLPKELEIKGVVLNSTSLIFGAQLRVPEVIRRAVTGADATKATQAYNDFNDLMVEKKAFDIQTGLITYNNMALEDIVIRRDQLTSDGLFFTAKFKELVIVTTEANNRSEDQYAEGKARDQNAPTRERGRTQAETVPNAEAEGAVNNIKQIKEEARA